jgi:hypothetical protein
VSEVGDHGNPWPDLLAFRCRDQLRRHNIALYNLGRVEMTGFWGVTDYLLFRTGMQLMSFKAEVVGLGEK